MLMMYECDRPQFENLMKSWHSYIYDGDAQIFVGNQVDWVVHQKSVNPPCPEEYYNRLVTAARYLYNNRSAFGVFIHDLSRVLGGRKGPYSSNEWFIAGAAAFTKTEEAYNNSPLKISIIDPGKIEINVPFSMNVNLEFLRNLSSFSGLEASVIFSEGIICLSREKIELSPKNRNENISFKLLANKLLPERDSKYMLAVRIEFIERKTGARNVEFAFIYAGVN